MASSYNELFGLGSHSEDAALEGWWPLQDNAASTAVDDVSSNGNDGTLVGGDNTADITTTGPNNWLTAALDLDGAADYISGISFSETGALTLAAYAKRDSTTTFDMIFGLSSAGTTKIGFSNDATNLFIRFVTNTKTETHGVTSTDWHHYGFVRSASNVGKNYVDGVIDNPNHAVTTSGTCTVDRFGLDDGSNYFGGPLAGVVAFSRELTAAEFAELVAGPEPINTVAPALSGTELVGETLTATSGTWALDAPFSGGSNGTVMPSYQWTRSDDDAGTGEADITDATNSTYVLTASDAGKYVRCRVRGANDGDLTITNAVASAAAETVDGVEYAAGKAITFDLAAAAGMTPSAPPTTEYEIYFDITTTGGEAHRIKKTVTVETRLEAL